MTVGQYSVFSIVLHNCVCCQYRLQHAVFQRQLVSKGGKVCKTKVVNQVALYSVLKCSEIVSHLKNKYADGLKSMVSQCE